MTMGGRLAGVGDECGTHRTEVLRWMNLGKVVGMIIAAGALSDSEVTVLNAVTDPVVALEANGVIGNSTGCRVVGE